jgi:anaerobic dimethyl sulfoxide reductase subunit A
MTGNVGIHGGDAAARAWESIAGGYPYPVGKIGAALPFVHNPVESPFRDTFFLCSYNYPRIHFTKVADAILKGKAAGYPADYKLAFLESVDYLNSFPNCNKTVKALEALEFVVVMEQSLTATTRYADILLPTSTYVERNDFALGVGMAYYGFQRKIIEPLGESKPQREIARELASRMGIADYDQETDEGRVRELAEGAGISGYETFKETGVYRIRLSEPYVAFKTQIDDPKNNPFPTPSGKIEIYSQRIADMDNPQLPPIPKYIEAWESPNDPLAQKYPIQLLTNHAKGRANSKFATLPWLKELFPQAIIISGTDGRARGIGNGDLVRVFNDRGEVRIPARVTERIMPGVAMLPAGAWYNPDEQGVDRGGCANVLTRDEPSPGGSFAYNTALVQIEKV